jgi:hypothetical protein
VAVTVCVAPAAIVGNVQWGRGTLPQLAASTFPGKYNQSSTFFASTLPLFAIRAVYVSVPPVATLSDEAVNCSDTGVKAPGAIVVVLVATLSESSGSTTVVTVAVWVRVPDVELTAVRVVNVIVAVPGANEGVWQVKTAQPQPAGSLVKSLTPVSVSSTFSALPGPMLVTVTVFE